MSEYTFFFNTKVIDSMILKKQVMDGRVQAYHYTAKTLFGVGRQLSHRGHFCFFCFWWWCCKCVHSKHPRQCLDIALCRQMKNLYLVVDLWFLESPWGVRWKYFPADALAIRSSTDPTYTKIVSQYDGPLRTLHTMMVDPNGTIKKLGGKDLPVIRGEIVDVIQFTSSKKVLCCNQFGKCM